jgi:hypothetical protein
LQRARILKFASSKIDDALHAPDRFDDTRKFKQRHRKGFLNFFPRQVRISAQTAMSSRRRIWHDLRRDDFNVRMRVPCQPSGAPQRVQRFPDTGEEYKDRDS